MTRRKLRQALPIAAALVTAFSGIHWWVQKAAGNDRDNVLEHLNAAISWYKELITKVPAGTEPSDSIYLNNTGNLSAQVVRLAFQSARAQVELDSQSTSGNGCASPKLGSV